MSNRMLSIKARTLLFMRGVAAFGMAQTESLSNSGIAKDAIDDMFSLS